MFLSTFNFDIIYHFFLLEKNKTFGNIGHEVDIDNLINYIIYYYCLLILIILNCFKSRFEVSRL